MPEEIFLNNKLYPNLYELTKQISVCEWNKHAPYYLVDAEWYAKLVHENALFTLEHKKLNYFYTGPLDSKGTTPHNFLWCGWWITAGPIPEDHLKYRSAK